MDDPRVTYGRAVDPPAAVRGDPAAVGPYRILGHLGAGGMGTVYLAESPAGTRVAVKVIRPELAGDVAFLDRFRREADAARRVAGFCTARVLDANLDGPAPYLVTEYVDGVRLDFVVDRDGPLSASNLEGLAVGVAAACAAIHAAEVVHRDLKPGNVLLSYFGPRVIDFGIARALDDATAALTRAGTIMGTPAWMAPEQFGREPVTTAADIFAWGGLVAYAGTGRLAFGTGPVEVLTYRIVHEAPDLDGLAEPLRRLVKLAMAKDPALRPSARDLLAELLDDADSSDPGSVGTQVTKVLQRTWVQEPAPAGQPRHAGSGPVGAAPPAPTGTAPAPTGTAPAPANGGGQPVPARARLPQAPAPLPPLPQPGWPDPSGYRQQGGPPAPVPGGYSGPRPPGPPRPTGWGMPPAYAGRRRRSARGVVVALVIVVLAALASHDNGNRGSYQGGSDSGQAGADSRSGVAVTSPSQATRARSAGAYRPVRDGKFEFRVTRFGCGPRTLGTGSSTIRAQGKFCLLTMQVRNIGREPRNFDANAQRLYAVGGSRHQVDGGATLRAGSRLLFVQINPGNSVSGTLIYDVPPSFRPLSAELHDSPLSRGARLTLG